MAKKDNNMKLTKKEVSDQCEEVDDDDLEVEDSLEEDLK